MPVNWTSRRKERVVERKRRGKKASWEESVVGRKRLRVWEDNHYWYLYWGLLYIVNDTLVPRELNVSCDTPCNAAPKFPGRTIFWVDTTTIDFPHWLRSWTVIVRFPTWYNCIDLFEMISALDFLGIKWFHNAPSAAKCRPWPWQVEKEEFWLSLAPGILVLLVLKPMTTVRDGVRLRALPSGMNCHQYWTDCGSGIGWFIDS